MPYEKQKVQAFGKAIIALFDALKDGLQLDQDSDEIVSMIQAASAAAPSIQAEADAAALHTASVLLDAIGDRRVAP